MPFAGYENFDACVKANQDKQDPEAYCGSIKHKVEDTIKPECLVKAYNHYSQKYPKLTKRDWLDMSFQYFRHKEDFVEEHTLDFILAEIALHLEDQIHDFMTHDAEATHLQELFEQMKEYERSYRTPEAQAMVEAMGQLTPPVEQITLPYSVMNTESGKRFQGEVIKNFRNNTTQLTPVSSSNVRGVGQFKNELLVQFRGNDRIAQRTYRYTMESPEMAEEAYNSLIDSPSPGRWVWENIRGHRAGEPVTSNKLAPSLSPPGKGRNTIGGTSASLLEYQISNRVPVSRVQGFEKAARQMERQTSNPSKNPNVGSRIEGALESRRSARDRGVNQLGMVRKLRQLPKLDFTLTYIGDISEEEAKARFKAVQKKVQARKQQECEWITKEDKEGKSYHVCIKPEKLQEINIPEKVRSKLRGGGGALVGTCIRVAENFLKENKKISNTTIQELIDRYGFGTKDIKHFVEQFDHYTKSAKKFIELQKEREEEKRKFEEKVKNQPMRSSENVKSENDLIETVSKYQIFREVPRSELEILSKHDNKNEIFLVSGKGIVFTGDRQRVIVGADQIPKDCTIIHTHPVSTRGKFKGLACPFSPTDYFTFLTTDAKKSIVFIQDGSGYMIEKTDETKYLNIEHFVKQEIKKYEKKAATDIVNENKSVDCGLFRFNRLICEKLNLDLKKFRWK